MTQWIGPYPRWMNHSSLRSPFFAPLLGLLGLLWALSPARSLSSPPANPTTHIATSQPTTRPTQHASTLPAPRPHPQQEQTSPHRQPPPSQSQKPPSQGQKPDQLEISLLQVGHLLREFLLKHGRDPDNPWLLAHTILALGKDVTLANGQKAIDRIVSGFLLFRRVGQRDIAYFPLGTNEQRIEPHPYMHLKNLLEIGVPLDYTWKVGEHQITLKRILEDAILSLPSAPKGEEIGKLAWWMFALFDHLPTSRWRWQNAEGQQINFLRMLIKFFRYLDEKTTFLRVLKNRGVKQIPKRRQYIYAEPCGGFHLIQAALRWMGHPLFRKRLQALFDAQVELIFYRFSGEMELYVSLFKQYQHVKAYRFIILLQQLKFLGHLLETIGDLHQWGLFQPDREQRRLIRQALKLLLLSVVLLNRLGSYDKIENLKTSNRQFYLDLLGDSAHAYHALDLLFKSKLYRDLPPNQSPTPK